MLFSLSSLHLLKVASWFSWIRSAPQKTSQWFCYLKIVPGIRRGDMLRLREWCMLGVESIVIRKRKCRTREDEHHCPQGKLYRTVVHRVLKKPKCRIKQWQPIIKNTLEMQIFLSIWDAWGCLPSALPTTHILRVFLLWPIAKLKSQLSVCQMELAVPKTVVSLFQGTLWNGFVFRQPFSGTLNQGLPRSPPPRAGARACLHKLIWEIWMYNYRGC